MTWRRTPKFDTRRAHNGSHEMFKNHGGISKTFAPVMTILENRKNVIGMRNEFFSTQTKNTRYPSCKRTAIISDVNKWHVTKVKTTRFSFFSKFAKAIRASNHDRVSYNVQNTLLGLIFGFDFFDKNNRLKKKNQSNPDQCRPRLNTLIWLDDGSKHESTVGRCIKHIHIGIAAVNNKLL